MPFFKPACPRRAFISTALRIPLVLGLLTAGALPASAQTANAASADVPELVTDRPDFTESSQVVGRGVLQFESGLTFERSGSPASRTGSLSTPLLLVRAGVGDRFELRFGGDGIVSESARTASGTNHLTGRSDVEVGFKYKLNAAPVRGFDFAVIPSLSLPTGADGITSDGYDPGVKFTWSRELPRGFGLSGNANLASVTADTSREWKPSLSVSLARGLAGSWAAYWEAYGFIADDTCACTINTGLTRTIGPNAQFDVEVGRALTSSAPDWFVGVGFAIRRVVR